MNVLVWHVHGSWMTSFVHGRHTYLLPTVADRSADGRGRAQTWAWPDAAVERTPAQLRDDHIDVVVLQSPRDEQLCAEWTGRRPGRDIPAVWLEHNAPQGRVNDMRHPAADRADVTVVHVTHTNDLFWDCGSTRTVVIEHGVVDPGHLYTGELERAAVVVNEPMRRSRVVGADLLSRFADAVALDVFGMGVTPLASARIDVHDDLPQRAMHDAIARRRVYLHTTRWTSLGLSVIEAMHIGMPIVALATTDAPSAIPPEAGVVSNDLDALCAALTRFVGDHELARSAGKGGRAAALARYGLGRFLDDWDQLLEEVTP